MKKYYLPDLIIAFILLSVLSIATYAAETKPVMTFGEFRSLFLHKPLSSLMEKIGKPTQEITSQKDGSVTEVWYEWNSIDEMPIKVIDHRKGHDKYYFDKIRVRFKRKSDIIQEIYFSNKKKILTEKATQQQEVALKQERLAEEQVKEQEELEKEKYDQKRRTTPSKIDKYFLKDMTLGSELEEFKKLFPRSSIHETKLDTRKNIASPIQYTGGSGTGWGQITDYKIIIDIPYLQYGYGISFIKYEQDFKEKVDDTVFLKSFKDDLQKRYGKPDSEYVKDVKSGTDYYACWGNRCGELKSKMDATPAPFNKFILWHSNYSEMGNIVEGKYLLVSYIHKMSSRKPMVTFILFDNSPLYRFKEVRKEKEIENATKKKVKF